MKIIEISEHKDIKKSQPLQAGYKRIKAIVIDDKGNRQTKHMDVKK